jgi:hypothetical protein
MKQGWLNQEPYGKLPWQRCLCTYISTNKLVLFRVCAVPLACYDFLPSVVPIVVFKIQRYFIDYITGHVF